MKIHKSGSWILWYECVGFGLLLVLSWLNEFGELSWLFGEEPPIPRLRHAAAESILILLVWGAVFFLTRRLVAHLLYLEGFLRVCAWCRKVGHNGAWMKLEDYFAQGFQITATHGVCPDCRKKIEEDTAQFYRQHFGRVAPSAEPTPQSPPGVSA